jgi:hypothetical protein
MLVVRKKQIEAGSLNLLTALRASLWVDSFIRTNQQPSTNDAKKNGGIYDTGIQKVNRGGGIFTLDSRLPSYDR